MNQSLAIFEALQLQKPLKYKQVGKVGGTEVIEIRNYDELGQLQLRQKSGKYFEIIERVSGAWCQSPKAKSSSFQPMPCSEFITHLLVILQKTPGKGMWLGQQSIHTSLSLRTTYSEPGKLSTKYDHSEFCKTHKLTKTKTLNGTMNLMVFYIIKNSSPRVLSVGNTKTTGCQTYKTHQY